MACIPFKFNHCLQANEYYYCTCKKRNFHVTFLKRNQTYSLSARAHNCFRCWFCLMVEIKVKKLWNKRNNIVHFTSLLADFFSFLNKFKHIYTTPDFDEIGTFDELRNSFGYFLDDFAPCLCCHGEEGPI